jgi:hypothetical protein
MDDHQQSGRGMHSAQPEYRWEPVDDDFFALELQRAAEQHTGAASEETIVAQVVDRVLARNPALNRASLEVRARADYEQLCVRPITTYIPNLMEHALREPVTHE